MAGPQIATDDLGGKGSAPEADQYLRTCKLFVSGSDTNGLDLSELRIRFAVKRSDTSTPNIADIRVYNLEEQTALRIKKEFNQVILEAGYAGNSGVIFRGNIRQVIIGRENATETFIDIIAGDGDRAYNFSVVNTTIAKGSSTSDQVSALVSTMVSNGVDAGNVGDMPTEKLPRGKVLYGDTKNYLRDIAQSTDKSWSIQDEKVTFISARSYLPGEVISINSTNGMIGIPNQTNDGVNIKCLLNPKIQIGQRLRINNADVIEQKLDLNQIAAAKSDVSQINKILPRRLNEDGMYRVLVLEYQGDTRGVEWYCSIVTINIDISTNPLNSISGGSIGP